MEVGTSQGNQKILPERSYRKRDRKNQRNHAKLSEIKHLEHRRVFTILSRQGVGIESQNPQYEFKEAFF